MRVLRQAEQEILGALVGRRDLERREDFFFRFHALAASEVAVREIGVRGRGVVGIERQDDLEFACGCVQIVALQREAAKHRARVGVKRIERGDALVRRTELGRIGHALRFHHADQLPRSVEVLEVRH